MKATTSNQNTMSAAFVLTRLGRTIQIANTRLKAVRVCQKTNSHSVTYGKLLALQGRLLSDYIFDMQQVIEAINPTEHVFQESLIIRQLLGKVRLMSAAHFKRCHFGARMELSLSKMRSIKKRLPKQND